MPHQVEVLDLAELTRETLIEFLPELKSCGVEPHIRIPEQHCFIQADRLSVMRIIANIVKNAVHYLGS